VGVLSGRGGGCLRYWKGVGGLEALLRNECGGEVKQGKDQVIPVGSAVESVALRLAEIWPCNLTSSRLVRDNSTNPHECLHVSSSVQTETKRVDITRLVRRCDSIAPRVAYLKSANHPVNWKAHLVGSKRRKTGLRICFGVKSTMYM
jgi:hypothetical protein